MQSVFENGGIIGNINRFSQYESIRTNLTYVGGYSIGIFGQTTDYSLTLTSLTGGADTAPQAGDLVIIAVELSGITNKSFRISGYTQITDLYANDTYDSNLQVGYKFMGSTPDTSAIITGGTGSISDAGAFAVHVWRNVDPKEPLDVISTTNIQTNTAIPNPPSITPITKNAVIIVAAGSAHVAGTQTFTASYLNNFITVGANDTYDATVGIGSIEWISDPYVPAAWTFSGTNNTAYSCNSVTIALRPKLIDVTKSTGIWSLKSVYDYNVSTPSLVGYTLSSFGASPKTVNVPTGTQNGDLIIAILSTINATRPNLNASFRTVYNEDFTEDAVNFVMQFLKITDASTQTSFTFTSGNNFAVVLLCFRNADFGSIGNLAENGSTMAIAPSMYTYDGRMLLNITMGRNTGDNILITNLTAPDGFTSILNDIGALNTIFHSISYKIWNGATSGESQATALGLTGQTDNLACHLKIAGGKRNVQF